MKPPYKKVKLRRTENGKAPAGGPPGEGGASPEPGPPCATHPERPAISQCSECGKALCKKCAREFISLAQRTRTGRMPSRLKGKGIVCCGECLRKLKRGEVYCPWEDGQLHFAKRFWITLKQVISTPDAFYLHFPKQGSLVKALGFAFLIIFRVVHVPPWVAVLLR